MSKGRKTKYQKSLKNNDYWNDVRRLIRLRDNWTCQICGSKVKLETHHITYFANRISIVGKEKEFLEWLILLCNDCHIGEKGVHSDINHVLNPKNVNKINAEPFKLLKWKK